MGNTKWVFMTRSVIGAIIAAGPWIMNVLGVGSEPNAWIQLSAGLNSILDTLFVVVGIATTIWGRMLAAYDSRRMTLLPKT